MSFFVSCADYNWHGSSKSDPILPLRQANHQVVFTATRWSIEPPGGLYRDQVVYRAFSQLAPKANYIDTVMSCTCAIPAVKGKGSIVKPVFSRVMYSWLLQASACASMIIQGFDPAYSDVC